MEYFHLDPPISHFQATSLIPSNDEKINQGIQGKGNRVSKGNDIMNLKDSTRIRPFEEILRAAGVEITEELRKSLPSTADMERMYGSEPVIVGLESCPKFRAKYGVKEAFMGPAGMFNTGTNLLERLMVNNCHINGRDRTTRLSNGGHIVKYQVPWGKHSPVDMRNHHVAADATGFDQEAFLPGLVIKDPYTWMDSMCRHKYAAHWIEFEGHCPNLVPINEEEKQKVEFEESVKLYVKYPYGKTTYHTSMVDLWNSYYGDWLKADFPKVVVRFEDLLVHAELVVKQLCDCVGGTFEPNNGGFVIPGPFQYELESAKIQGGKVHGGSNDLVSSLIKYGTLGNRVRSYTPEDLEYARKELDKDIMKMFNYPDPLEIKS